MMKMLGGASDRRRSRELDEQGVLVVEDNLGDADLVREHLPGTKVVHASTLAQALRDFATVKPAVALVDLGLPDAAGLDSIAKLRAVAPTLPIVVFTSTDDDDIVRLALQGYAQDYVVKGAFDERLLRRCLVYAIERHAGERERERLRERMIVSERMASVGTLAAGVAHEINNPLTSVAANLELLEEELRSLGESELQTGLLAMIHDAKAGAERVREIVAGLRGFSRHGDERATAVDVDEVIETAIRMTRSQIRHHARLVRELRAVPPVTADAGRLAQVLINLLVNAAQAIEGGRAEENTITVRTGRRREAVVVEIVDTGRGIPAEDQERIFEPFFTTKAIGEGTGLGLWICRNIVNGFGGNIEVESTVGKGTSFRVVLEPSAMTPSTAPFGVASSTPPAVARRVLVIDDDPLVARAVSRMLRGYRVTVVSSGADGLRALAEQSGGFDVILCDVMMPEMTGMDFFDALGAQPDVRERIVFMTGGAFTPAARAFLERTPNRRVEKPLDGRVLRAIVDGAPE